LSHAEDEVNFYEEALQLLKRPGAEGLAPLLGFTFEYAGVLRSCEESHGTQRSNELLVMKNLRSGYSTLRTLDIKIGQKTAQAGWQGKSRAAALRQSVVDGITNSSCEGFRLEGFDGRPATLSSMDPLLDIGVTGNEKMAKKALRVMLQRMTGAEMLLHFLDVHQEQPAVDLELQLSPLEVAELAAFEVLRQLAKLSVACRRSPVPQKWIGSSVGLGFDAGHLPARDVGEEQVRRSTQVHIFDWGRSELNTLDKHLKLTEKEQYDRGEFWRYYVGGVDRLAWEAARCYRQRFGNKSSWTHVTIKISDFDSMSENDFIGQLTLPVEETPETTADILTQSGSREVLGDYGLRGPASLTYSISWQAYPKKSRLQGAWQVRIVRAQNLPRQDKMQLRTTSDPICEITAFSADPVLCCKQLSSVKVRSLNPEWNETFDLPIMREAAGGVEDALESAATGLGSGSVFHLFPPEKIPQWQKDGLVAMKTPSRWSSNESQKDEADVEKALEEWKARLEIASATADDEKSTEQSPALPPIVHSPPLRRRNDADAAQKSCEEAVAETIDQKLKIADQLLVSPRVPHVLELNDVNQPRSGWWAACNCTGAE